VSTSTSSRVCTSRRTLVSHSVIVLTPTNRINQRDSLASRTSHLKDGLNRLFCLVPYEVVTEEIWDYVMPHWMEAIVNDVPEKELSELKIILSKILDTEMSPLGFDATKMYNFVAVRFEKASSRVQEQALHWLQVCHTTNATHI
jgi:Cation-channel complex subunit UNC-79